MLLGDDKSISFNSLCEKLEALNDKYCTGYTIEDVDNLPSIRFLRISEKACMSASLELCIKINKEYESFMVVFIVTPEILDMSTQDFLDYIEKTITAQDPVIIVKTSD